MSTWKKILIWCGVALAICLIAFYIMYFTVRNVDIPAMAEGQYNLTKVTKVENSEETIVEQFEGEEFYLVVKPQNELESFSAGKGVETVEGGYQYFLHGKELIIFLPDENGTVAYTGLYADQTIKITIKEGEQTFYYYYSLKNV